MRKVKPPRTTIPHVILSGSAGNYFLPVHREFINRTMQQFLRIAYESYYERSHLDQEPEMRDKNPKTGRADKDGNTWEQLRPSTYRIKRALARTGKLKDHLKRRRSDAARQTRKLHNRIRFDGDGINIRTGQLLASFFPGAVVNGVLQSRPDQILVKEKTKLGFIPNVDHWEDVNNSKRPILTDDMEEKWMVEAMRYGIQRAEVVYEALKNSPENPHKRRIR